MECSDSRIVKNNILQDYIGSLSLPMSKFDILSLEKKDYYLVFGSFLVIENFLKRYKKNEER